LPAEAQDGRLFSSNGDLYLSIEGGYYRSNPSTDSPLWTKNTFPDPAITSIFAGQNGLFAYGQKAGFYQELQGSGLWMPLGNTLKGKSVITLLETPDGSVVIGSESGIYKSSDGCKTWRHVMEDDMITSLFETNGILFGCGVKGLVHSADGGETWNYKYTGHGRPIQAQNIDGGFAVIFIGDNSQPQGNINGLKNNLYFTADQGKTWSLLNGNLPSVRDLYEIQQAGAYLYCSLDAGIFRSADKGKTWELVHPARDKERFELVVSGTTIFAKLGQSGC
jgi:photosystem II stability/assembly factor-like uncharacterized protein